MVLEVHADAGERFSYPHLLHLGRRAAEEECQDLTDLRRPAGLQTRHEIAAQSIPYEHEHAQGITPVGNDPEDYVSQPS